MHPCCCHVHISTTSTSSQRSPCSPPPAALLALDPLPLPGRISVLQICTGSRRVLLLRPAPPPLPHDGEASAAAAHAGGSGRPAPQLPLQPPQQQQPMEHAHRRLLPPAVVALLEDRAVIKAGVGTSGRVVNPGSVRWGANLRCLVRITCHGQGHLHWVTCK